MNWVPTEAIDHIEVLRGPAAARYGNGAAGGVVNIVTKGTPDKFGASATLYYGKRQHKEEGGERRASFSLAGPISDMLGFRLTGNIAKTDSDAWDINRGHASTRTGTFAGTFPAGREGVRNRDLDARLSLRPNTMHRIDLDASFSRQGNIYTGDTQNTNNFTTLPNGQLAPTSQRVRDAIGSETNRMYRTNYALTHTGRYEGGASSTAYLQYEATRNTRMDEGLAGGTEGLFSDGTFTTAKLDTTTLHGEYNQPGKWGELDHVMTLGAEVVNQKFTDRNSVSQTTTEGGTIAGLSGTGRSPKIDAKIYSVFVEDNIELTRDTILTPGVRFDHHSKAGNNWSPSLNLSHSLTREITLKAGIARAYKAPNLYQLNPNYLLYSRGIGCWGGGGACYLMGNSNLKAETSINTELGAEYADEVLVAGLTWFHNDYRNKIDAGHTAIGKATGGQGRFANANVFQWDNVPKALVHGLEGTFNYRFTPQLSWSNNLTYMIKSENKSTGEQLSIIPKYTVNSRLDWKLTEEASVFGSAMFYGKQKANKLDYQGLPVQGEESTNLSPYALVGLGGSYAINRNFKVGLGIENLLDKRLYRRGNAVGVNNPRTIYGAGAATYNEPGRMFYITLNATL